jgi:hypothetical protein
MQRRKHQTLDKARILQEIKQRAPRLANRDTKEKLQDFPG